MLHWLAACSLALMTAATVVNDAKPGHAAGPSPEDASIGGWQISIWVDSEAPPSTHGSDLNRRSRLIVQCTRGHLVIIVWWNSDAVSSGETPEPMRMWFDDELAESRDWTYDNASAYQGKNAWLVERLLDARTFRIDYGGQEVRNQKISARFDVSGFGEALKSVQRFCEW